MLEKSDLESDGSSTIVGMQRVIETHADKNLQVEVSDLLENNSEYETYRQKMISLIFNPFDTDQVETEQLSLDIATSYKSNLIITGDKSQELIEPGYELEESTNLETNKTNYLIGTNAILLLR